MTGAWSLLGVPRHARPTRATRAAPTPTCPACGGRAAPLATALDVVLDGWRGEPLFAAGPWLLVTAPLAAAIEAARLTGCALHPARARSPRGRRPAPEVRELAVTGACRGPSGWWRRGDPCAACGRPAWHDDPARAATRAAAAAGAPAPPREVWRASWRHDLAQPDDPGPPVVSARARALLDGLSAGLRFHPVALVGPARAPSDGVLRLERIRDGLRDHERARAGAHAPTPAAAAQ